MNPARAVTTVLVLGAIVAAAVVLAGGEKRAEVEIVSTVEGLDPALFQSAQGCGTCHAEIYAEWRDSWHAQSMTDPYFLEKLREQPAGEENTACLDCHIPMPIHETGIGVDMRPRMRKGQERRNDGIDCITCHKMGEGVAASRPGLTGACNPIYVPDETGAESCNGCHNQHWTVDEWEKSPYAKGENRQTCLDCHMPLVDRAAAGGKPARKERSHSMHGGRHLPELQKAVTFGAALEGRTVVASTTNSGAGHKLPTDSRHRSFNVMIWFYDASGNLVDGPREIAEYRLYYRGSNRKHTQIPPLETARAEAKVPAGLTGGRAVVRLYYCLTPFYAGKLRLDPERAGAGASLVAEASVPIE